MIRQGAPKGAPDRGSKPREEESNHEARRTMNLNLRTNTGQGALIEGMEGEPYEPTPRAHRPPATDWNGDTYRPDTFSEDRPVRLEIVTKDDQTELF